VASAGAIGCVGGVDNPTVEEGVADDEAPPPPPPPVQDPPKPVDDPAPQLTASFTRDASWDGGFAGSYTIANRGVAAVGGWALELELPAGASIVAAPDATVRVSGQRYTLTGAGAIAVGGSLRIDFVVEGGAPLGCAINGVACE